MKVDAESFVRENNIDRLRILEEGYFISYKRTSDNLTYEILPYIDNEDLKLHRVLLWGCQSTDYIDDFADLLIRRGLYTDFMNCKDPFIFVLVNKLIKKVKPTQSIFNVGNEYNLVHTKPKRKKEKCCILV